MEFLKGQESLVDQAQLLNKGSSQSQPYEQGQLNESIETMHKQFSLKNSYLKDLLSQSIATLNLIKQLTKDQQVSEQSEQTQNLYGLELTKQSDLNQYLNNLEKLRSAEIQLEKAAQNCLQNNLTGALMSIREAFKNFREVYPDCQVFYDPYDSQGQKIVNIQQGMVLLDEFLPKLQEKYIQNLVTLRLCLDKTGLNWDQTEQVNDAYQRYIALFGNGSTQIPQAQGQGQPNKVEISFKLKPAIIGKQISGVKAENIYANEQDQQEALKQFLNKIINNLSKILRTHYGFDDSYLLNQIPLSYSLQDQIKTAFEQTQQMMKQAQQCKTQSLQTIQLFNLDKPQESQSIFDLEKYKEHCMNDKLNQLQSEVKSLKEQLEAAKKNMAMFQESTESGDSKLRDLINKLQKQNEDLQGQIRSQDQKYSDKCFEYDKLLQDEEKAKKNLMQELDQLRPIVQKCSDEAHAQTIKDLQDQAKQLWNQVNDLTNQNDQLKQSNDQANKKIQELEDLIKQLQNQIKNQNEQMTKSGSDLNQQNLAQTNEIQLKNKQLEDLKKQIDNLENTKNSLLNELEKVRPIAQKCESEGHNEKIKELEKVRPIAQKCESEAHNEKIKELEKVRPIAQKCESEAHDEKIKELEKVRPIAQKCESEAHDEKIKELEKVRPIAQKCESEAHNGKIKELENQNQLLQQSNDAANKKIKELEDILNQLKNQLKQENDKNLQSLKTIEDLNQQIAALKNEFQQKLTQNDQKQSSDSQNLNSAISDLTNKNKELTQKLNDLTSQNEKKQQLLDEANKKIKELEDLIKQLQDQLKEQQDQNSKIEKSNADLNQQITVLKFEIHQKIQNIEELMAWIVEIECTNGSLKREIDEIRPLLPKKKVQA